MTAPHVRLSTAPALLACRVLDAVSHHATPDEQIDTIEVDADALADARSELHIALDPDLAASIETVVWEPIRDHARQILAVYQQTEGQARAQYQDVTDFMCAHFASRGLTLHDPATTRAGYVAVGGLAIVATQLIEAGLLDPGAGPAIGHVVRQVLVAIIRHMPPEVFAS